MVAFDKWIEGYYPKALPGGKMNKALIYTYNMSMRLSLYHLDGRPFATPLEKIQPLPAFFRKHQLIPENSCRIYKIPHRLVIVLFHTGPTEYLPSFKLFLSDTADILDTLFKPFLLFVF